MPSLPDIAFAVFFAVGVYGVVGFFADRRLRRRIAAGVPNVRLDAFRRAVAVQWAMAAVALLLWWRDGRSWASLGLVPPSDWRLWVGLGVMVAVGALTIRQNLRVRELSPERIERLRQRMAHVDILLPHTEREFQWLMALSCTAGVCEELLYRGFLTWLVASYVGIVAAVVIVSIVFGAAHAYQGVKGVGAVALVMSGIVLTSGWLIPAMVIHALMDVAGGVVGFRVTGSDTVFAT